MSGNTDCDKGKLVTRQSVLSLGNGNWTALWNVSVLFDILKCVFRYKY